MSQDEAEDAALLSCLQACHDLYSRQQQFAHSTRKGFMNVAKARQSMSDGSFNPYSGPVNKQNGEVVIPSGSVMDDGGLWGMDYFVEGVIGTMPD